ncbi:hypothetical protein DL768_008604 [Monosporascus sp. mg162]|nr:hypothetical protein DL768_008604 [Monosporascus sp. mg162]
MPRKTPYYGNVDDLGNRHVSDKPKQRVLLLGLYHPTRWAEPGGLPEEMLSGTSTINIALPHVATEQPSDRPRAVVADGRICSEEPSSLIRDTSRREHYNGPSGGFRFLGQLRRLLSSREQQASIEAGTSPSTVSQFAEDSGAKALEASEHPPNPTKSDDEVERADAILPSHMFPGSTTSLVNDFARSGVDASKSTGSSFLRSQVFSSWCTCISKDYTWIFPCSIADDLRKSRSSTFERYNALPDLSLVTDKGPETMN